MRILRREMNDEEKNEINSLINCYYVLMEGADMLLRRSQVFYSNFGMDLNGPMKLRHNRMMQHMRALISLQDDFFKDYGCFGNGDKFIKTYDAMRDASSFLTRLTLLIGDRTCREDEKQVRQKIWDYIYYLPEQGLITDKALDSLKIK